MPKTEKYYIVQLNHRNWLSNYGSTTLMDYAKKFTTHTAAATAKRSAQKQYRDAVILKIEKELE